MRRPARARVAPVPDGDLGTGTMRHVRGARGAGAGFTLIEVLMALAVLLAVLVPLLDTQVMHHKALARLEDRVHFDGLAARVVEAAAREDLETLAGFSEVERVTWTERVVEDTDVDGVAVHTDLEAIPGDPEARVLLVSVQWIDPRAEGRSIRYETRLQRVLRSHRGSLVRPVAIE